MTAPAYLEDRDLATLTREHPILAQNPYVEVISANRLIGCGADIMPLSVFLQDSYGEPWDDQQIAQMLTKLAKGEEYAFTYQGQQYWVGLER